MFDLSILLQATRFFCISHKVHFYELRQSKGQDATVLIILGMQNSFADVKQLLDVDITAKLRINIHFFYGNYWIKGITSF